MAWVEVFVAFVVCHVVGDFLLQTEWQATNKHGGLGSRPVARRALFSHVATYSLAFVPALVWLAESVSVAAVVAVALANAAAHLIQDDGRPLEAYVRLVKHTELRPGALAVAIDQSFHLVVLFGLALAVSA